MAFRTTIDIHDFDYKNKLNEFTKLKSVENHFSNDPKDKNSFKHLVHRDINKRKGNELLVNKLKKYARYASEAYCLNSIKNSLNTTSNIIYAFPNIKNAWVDGHLMEEYLTINKELIQRVTKILAQNPKIEKIRLTGHFLGGAGIQLKRLNGKGLLTSGVIRPLEIQVFSYGSPRIGNWEFGQSLDQLFTLYGPQGKMYRSYYRVTYDDDTVSQMPRKKGYLGYMHNSMELWISPFDCDCTGDNETVFLCSGVETEPKYMDEPEPCDQAWDPVLPKNDPKSLDLWSCLGSAVLGLDGPINISTASFSLHRI
ncbi:hypothetical protein G9A89_009782 [Geosiphon pyriformis]|nr:hypothetical protein G9A89_009782 [Geosiphon pyriformis]